jgi:hypothetical protein
MANRRVPCGRLVGDTRDYSRVSDLDIWLAIPTVQNIDGRIWQNDESPAGDSSATQEIILVFSDLDIWLAIPAVQNIDGAYGKTTCPLRETRRRHNANCLFVPKKNFLAYCVDKFFIVHSVHLPSAFCAFEDAQVLII